MLNKAKQVINKEELVPEPRVIRHEERLETEAEVQKEIELDMLIAKNETREAMMEKWKDVKGRTLYFSSKRQTDHIKD